MNFDWKLLVPGAIRTLFDFSACCCISYTQGVAGLLYLRWRCEKEQSRERGRGKGPVCVPSESILIRSFAGMEPLTSRIICHEYQWHIQWCNTRSLATFQHFAPGLMRHTLCLCCKPKGERNERTNGSMQKSYCRRTQVLRGANNV